MNIPQQILVTRMPGKNRHFVFDMGALGKAELKYTNYWCKNAEATINDKKWKFLRKGFWEKEIEIIAEQSPYTKTNIKCSAWSHKLSVRAEDNNMYYFKSAGFWKWTHAWFDSGDQKLLEIKSNSFSRKRRGTITLHQPVRPELLWLMLLGWFQVVYYEDAAAVAAAA